MSVLRLLHFYFFFVMTTCKIPFSHTSTGKLVGWGYFCCTSLITGGEPVTGLQKVTRGREAETIF